MADRPRGLLGRISGIGVALENAALVLLLGAMMVLATAKVVALVGFDASLVWADPLIEFMVLWIALIASIAAARSGRHLSIDILSHLVPPRWARLPAAIAAGFAAGICGLLAWHGFRYVQLTREFGDTVLFDLPAWTAYGMMPLAFALMTWHFSLACLRNAWQLLRPPPAEEGA